MESNLFLSKRLKELFVSELFVCLFLSCRPQQDSENNKHSSAQTIEQPCLNPGSKNLNLLSLFAAAGVELWHFQSDSVLVHTNFIDLLISQHSDY